jgi:hypothetical protein
MWVDLEDDAFIFSSSPVERVFVSPRNQLRREINAKSIGVQQKIGRMTRGVPGSVALAYQGFAGSLSRFVSDNQRRVDGHISGRGGVIVDVREHRRARSERRIDVHQPGSSPVTGQNAAPRRIPSAPREVNADERSFTHAHDDKSPKRRTLGIDAPLTKSCNFNAYLNSYSPPLPETTAPPYRSDRLTPAHRATASASCPAKSRRRISGRADSCPTRNSRRNLFP